MKNYPNQASTFARVRGTLETIQSLNSQRLDPGSDEILGYAAARQGHYTFRGFDITDATEHQIETFFAAERTKPKGSQGAQTFARELRRTLRDMNWIGANHQLTPQGQAVLKSDLGSVEEQALLVEALLGIEATYRDGSHPHHPIRTMLRLLGHHSSHSRQGLELALEPKNDSEQEFNRVLALYKMSPSERLESLEITEHQRANAVKIFPSLAVYAGLVSQQDRVYALTTEGWSVIGKTDPQASKVLRNRPGRRTTVGKKVTPETAASFINDGPLKALSVEEQQRALEKLQERTAAHQALVQRIAKHIGNSNGQLFEDPFSFDLLWVPSDPASAVYLFEMKTITDQTDAYARARSAMAQLRYYDYFHVRHTLDGRPIRHIAAFNHPLPSGLVDFLSFENMGVVVSDELTNTLTHHNQLGQEWLDQIR